MIRVLLAFLLCAATVAAQPVITPPPGGAGGGSGDITGVYSCTEGQCSDIDVVDGEKLDFSQVNPTSGGDGLVLPQASSCTGVTGEGFLCWDTDDNTLWIGDGSGISGIGTGDISSVFTCTSGACSNLTLDDSQLLNMGSVSVTSTTEGLILPQNSSSCASGTAEGQICWNSTSDTLWIGDGAASIEIPQGDITDIFSCASGDCSSVSLADGDLLNMSSVNPNTTTEGLILPQGTVCTGSTAEGQICWDSDSDTLWIGDSSSSVQISGGEGAGDITSVFDCTEGACANLAPADSQLIDLGGIILDTTTEGLILPYASPDLEEGFCSLATAQGQVCWDIDDSQLWIGDGTGTVRIGAIGSVWDCAQGDCNQFTLIDGDGFDASATDPTGAGEGVILPQLADCSVISIEGTACWDTDDNSLWIGNGVGATEITVGAGITDVWGCTSSTCNSFTLDSTDTLNFAGVDIDDTGAGLILPQSTTCATTIDEGQVCWDSDNDTLYIGDATAAVAITGGAGSGDITDVFGCSSGDCDDITMGVGDVLDMTSGDVILSQHATDCSNYLADGQPCWEVDAEMFWIGDGAAAQKIGPLTLGESAAYGASITTANSRANAVFIGDSSNDGTLHYTDENGPTQECVLDWGGAGEDTCDYKINAATGDSILLQINDVPIQTIDGNGVGLDLPSGDTFTVDINSVNVTTVASTGITVTGSVTATGQTTGLVRHSNNTTATVTLLGADCRGGYHKNSDADAIDFTLCDGETGGGQMVCFEDRAGGIITVDVADTGETITLADGTALTAGNAIDLSSGIGHGFCLLSDSSTAWHVLPGAVGTISDGGAD